MRLFMVSLLMSAVVSTVVFGIHAAETPAERRGYEIAAEADRRANEGFGDVRVNATMILTDRRGRESVRKLQFSVLDGRDEGDKTLTVFERPPDVEGTAFLTWSKKIGNDDQWLYLPALKRVKRITSENQSGSFMGSEFSYEDISSQELEKYTYRYLRDDGVDGQPVFVFERVPVDADSGYSSQEVHVDKEHYRTLRVHYFNKRGDRFKTLEVSGYQLYLDRYWRPEKFLMTNHQTNKSTTLLLEDYRFRTGLEEQYFTRANLRQLR